MRASYINRSSCGYRKWIALTRNDKHHATRMLPCNAMRCLKHVQFDDMAENLSTYANPNLALVGGLIEALSEFVGPQHQK